MTSRGRAATDQASLRTIEKELKVVPSHILEAVAANDTRIVVVNEGEDPLSVEPAEGPPLLPHVDAAAHGEKLSQALPKLLNGVDHRVRHLDVALQSADPAMRNLLEHQRHQMLANEVETRGNEGKGVRLPFGARPDYFGGDRQA